MDTTGSLACPPAASAAAIKQEGAKCLLHGGRAEMRVRNTTTTTTTLPHTHTPAALCSPETASSAACRTSARPTSNGSVPRHVVQCAVALVAPAGSIIASCCIACETHLEPLHPRDVFAARRQHMPKVAPFHVLCHNAQTQLVSEPSVARAVYLRVHTHTHTHTHTHRQRAAQKNARQGMKVSCIARGEKRSCNPFFQTKFRKFGKKGPIRSRG